MARDPQRILGFLIFAVAFGGLLTLVVRLAKLHVRGEIGVYQRDWPDGVVRCRGSGGVVVSDARQAERADRSAADSAQPAGSACRPLCRCTSSRAWCAARFTSWLRVTAGFTLAAIVAVPLGIYMATFPSDRRVLSAAGAGGRLCADRRLHSAEHDLVRHWRSPEDWVPVHRLLCGAAAAGHQGHRRCADRLSGRGGHQGRLAMATGAACAVSGGPGEHLGPSARRVWRGLGLDHHGRSRTCCRNMAWAA